MRILSGIQSSGTLHLGNYFGMMRRMIKYQNESELFCFIPIRKRELFLKLETLTP